MTVLALDTCFAACSVAVAVGEGDSARRVVSECVAMETGHAEALMPMIGRGVADAGITVRDIDTIIVTHGPGTFTGVRIGVAAARAIGLATGAHVVGVSSLRAIGFQSSLSNVGALGEEDGVLVAMDARKGQVYAQVVSGDGAELTEPLLVTPEAAAGLCPGRRVRVVGNAAEVVSSALLSCGRASLAGHAQTSGADACFLNAEILIRMAASSVRGGPVSPLYLRPADAKAQEGKSLAWRGAP